jgi:hypothetical protein
MNSILFNQEFLSDNVLLISGTLVLSLSLAGVFYILQSRGYIFNHDTTSSTSDSTSGTVEGIESVSEDSNKGDSTLKSNVDNEISPLPTSGQSDDPSLEVTPKSKTVELSNNEDETLSEHSEHTSTSSSSSSSSKTVQSDYFRKNDDKDQNIDHVDTVSDYKTAIDNGSVLDDKISSDKDVQNISDNSSISLVRKILDMTNKYNDKLDKLRSDINSIYVEKYNRLYQKSLELINNNNALIK